MISQSSFGHYKSGWELGVAKSLVEAKIPFYYESPKFPIDDFVYTPDFLLSKLRICKKNVILEPHGLMSRRDAYKFASFRHHYGDDSLLVLITRNDTIPFVSKETYDHVWPIEHVDLLMEKMKSGRF